MNDLRFALRQLTRHPGFTAVAVITLALGIGANTAIFSVVDAYLLKPLPYPHADRLVSVLDVQPGYGEAPASFQEWRDLLEHGRMFNALAATFAINVNYADDELPERLRLQLVSEGYFDIFGLEIVAGRGFAAEEELEGGPPAIVVSQSFWTTRLGGRTDAIGRAVRLSDRAYTLVGVVRDRIESVESPIAAYAPLVPNAPWRDQGSHYLRLTGRLNEGASLEGARAELADVATRLQEDRGTTHGWTMTPLRERLAGGVRPLLLALLGAVGLVLLIATANVAALLLVRAAGRRTEFAVRSALGAPRRRLIRQLLAEGLVLGCLGAGAGALVGIWGTRVLVHALPANLTPPGHVAFDLRVFLFTGVVALASAVLFGLVPGLFETRQASARIGGGTRATGHSPGARRMRDALVVVELGMALVLLIGAALTIQSLGRLLRVDPGFRADGLLTLSTTLPDTRYPGPPQRLAFVDDMTARVAGLPGVTGVAVANNLPLGGSMNGDVRIEGRDDNDGERLNAEKRIISEDYFEVLGIQLRQGRGFTAADRQESPPVVIVSEAMVQRVWPGETALGKRIRSLTCGDCWEEVVGVVADVREYAVHQAAPMHVYYPVRQAPLGRMHVVVRADGDPTALVALVRRAVADVDPLQPVYNTRTMAEVVAGSVADRRLITFLLTAFAVLATLLAAVGVGGVISYAVARRTREIGLRMALGAARGEVVGLVVGQGMRLAALGLAFGLPLAFVLSRFLRTQLYEVTPVQPVAYAGSAIVLALVALASCYWPARRAARVDPMEALRHE